MEHLNKNKALREAKKYEEKGRKHFKKSIINKFNLYKSAYNYEYSAIIYMDINYHQEAIQNLNKAKEIYLELEEHLSLIKVYESIGYLYIKINEEIKAINYFDLASNLYSQLGNIKESADILLKPFDLISISNNKSIIIILEKAIKIYKEIREGEFVNQGYKYLLQIYLKYICINKAIDVVENINSNAFKYNLDFFKFSSIISILIFQLYKNNLDSVNQVIKSINIIDYNLDKSKIQFIKDLLLIIKVKNKIEWENFILNNTQYFISEEFINFSLNLNINNINETIINLLNPNFLCDSFIASFNKNLVLFNRHESIDLDESESSEEETILSNNKNYSRISNKTINFIINEHKIEDIIDYYYFYLKRDISPIKKPIPFSIINNKYKPILNTINEIEYSNNIKTKKRLSIDHNPIIMMNYKNIINMILLDWVTCLSYYIYILALTISYFYK